MLDTKNRSPLTRYIPGSTTDTEVKCATRRANITIAQTTPSTTPIASTAAEVFGWRGVFLGAAILMQRRVVDGGWDPSPARVPVGAAAGTGAVSPAAVCSSPVRSEASSTGGRAAVLSVASPGSTPARPASAEAASLEAASAEVASADAAPTA